MHGNGFCGQGSTLLDDRCHIRDGAGHDGENAFFQHTFGDRLENPCQAGDPEVECDLETDPRPGRAGLDQPSAAEYLEVTRELLERDAAVGGL